MYLISNNIALAAVSGGVCILGDYLVDINQQSQIRKAISDNVTHATIGLFSALIMISEANQRIVGTERIGLVALSIVLSSFIDLDHFVVAKSLRLSNAVSIDRRPFMHFTTIPITLMLFMLPLFRLFRSPRLNLWLGIIVCALIAHHTRDATRRGFTLWPFGTTKALPYYVYVVCVMAVPFLMAKWFNFSIAEHQNRYHHLEMTTV